MAYWTNLPVGIRDIILDIVVADYRFDEESPYVRASYASVSREWQSAFERINSQRLKLDQESVTCLEQYANPQRRVYLEHLFLRIRLNEYDCTECQLKEDRKTIRR